MHRSALTTALDAPTAHSWGEPLASAGCRGSPMAAMFLQPAKRRSTEMPLDQKHATPA